MSTAAAMAVTYNAQTRSFRSVADGVSSGALSTATNASASGEKPFKGGDAPNFSDLLDILNPLQHIPVVNFVYRQLTGDTESHMADIIGGTLYGGPIGLASALADQGLRSTTGKSIDEHIASLLGLDQAKPANDTQIASADKTPSSAKVLLPGTAVEKAMSGTMTPAPSPAAADVPPAPVVTTPLAAATQAAADGAETSPPIRIMAGPIADDATKPAPKPMPAAIAAGGPAMVGDYLVFSAKGVPQAANGPQADAPSAAPVAANAGRDFKVFGGVNGTMPGELPPAAAQARPQLASAQGPKVFPVPPRNGPAKPIATLPPPTTGPGALPGGKSMALDAATLASMQDQNSGFVGMYMQALQKYQAMQSAGASAAPASLLAPAPVDAPAETAEH